MTGNLKKRVFSANELDEETAVVDMEETLKRRFGEYRIRGEKSTSISGS